MDNQGGAVQYDDDGEFSDGYIDRKSLLWQHHLHQKLRLSVWINAVLLAVVLFLPFLMNSPFTPGDRVEAEAGGPTVTAIYSPANEIVEYEYRAHIRNDTRFVGYPSLLWEQSMHDVLAGTLIRVSSDELQLLGGSSIPLKDGGYAAGLGVAHNLHCVKKLKQWMYREHFYPQLELNGPEFHMLQEHADHCLDFIRQGIMCNIDYSLYTLHWEANTSRLLHGYPEKQRCVNWDKLHDWMLSRAASSDMLDTETL